MSGKIKPRDIVPISQLGYKYEDPERIAKEYEQLDAFLKINKPRRAEGVLYPYGAEGKAYIAREGGDIILIKEDINGQKAWTARYTKRGRFIHKEFFDYKIKDSRSRKVDIEGKADKWIWSSIRNTPDLACLKFSRDKDFRINEFTNKVFLKEPKTNKSYSWIRRVYDEFLAVWDMYYATKNPYDNKYKDNKGEEIFNLLNYIPDPFGGKEKARLIVTENFIEIRGKNSKGDKYKLFYKKSGNYITKHYMDSQKEEITTLKLDEKGEPNLILDRFLSKKS